MGRGEDDSLTDAPQTREEAGEDGKDFPPPSRLVYRRDKNIIEKLREAPIFQKEGMIKAKQVKSGTKVETVLANGLLETINVSDDGDWVVTNPSGERYIVPGDEFIKKYEKSEEEGVFRAKGYVRAIKNPFQERISLQASWGELQHGGRDCFFVQSCDARGNLSGDPYLINRATFRETYHQVSGKD